jgi:drug/metabolite transporter (DMT)-like permease
VVAGVILDPRLLAIAAAVLSAGATIFIRQGLREGATITGVWINVLVGTVGLWIAVLATGGVYRVSAAGIALFAVAGVIGTVSGRVLRFMAIEKVGASIAAALNNLHPLFAAVLAIAVLGEHVTLPIVAGTVVIVLGTALLSSGGRRAGVRARHLWLPIASAACFGIVAVLRKIGLGQMGPVQGAAINATTALVVFTGFLVASGQRGAMVSRGRSLAHFVAAGVTENLAVFLNILALSVVTPLVGTSPVFVLLLSPLFLRGVEGIGARVVAGTLLIVAGIYLVTALGG